MTRFAFASPLVAAALVATTALGCAGPASRGVVFEVPVPETNALWVPWRVGTFALGAHRQFEDETEGSLYRFVGPDSVFIDVQLSGGPDLESGCSEACARTMMQAEVAGVVRTPDALARGLGLQRLTAESSTALTAAESDAWRLGHAARFRGERNGVPMRAEYHLRYVPTLRFDIRTAYPDTPQHTAWVAEFVRYVVDAFSTPPLPMPAPTQLAILQTLEGEWDWSNSPLLCGPGRHRIWVGAGGDRFTVEDVVPDSAALPAVEYAIVRVGAGLLAEAAHVIRARMEGETRRDARGELVHWNLVLDSTDRYSWHRSDWDEGSRSVGVLRCDRGPY